MKKEKIIKVKIMKDYPLVTSKRTKKEPSFDKIGEYVHDILQLTCSREGYGRSDEETRKFVRKIVVVAFGKKVADKYTDDELEDVWFQYEPQ